MRRAREGCDFGKWMGFGDGSSLLSEIVWPWKSPTRGLAESLKMISVNGLVNLIPPESFELMLGKRKECGGKVE